MIFLHLKEDFLIIFLISLNAIETDASIIKSKFLHLLNSTNTEQPAILSNLYESDDNIPASEDIGAPKNAPNLVSKFNLIPLDYNFTKPSLVSLDTLIYQTIQRNEPELIQNHLRNINLDGEGGRKKRDLSLLLPFFFNFLKGFGFATTPTAPPAPPASGTIFAGYPARRG